MKLRHLFMAVIAGAFAFTACEDEIDLGAAKVSFVEPAGLVLNFGPEESSANVTFVCTRDWNISEVLSNTLPDWIALSATSGEGSAKEQSVTVTVMANPGNDRETGVTFTIGLAKATLTVKQQGKMGEIKKGSGTKEDPFSVAGVRAYVQELGADVQSPKSVYVKGIVSDVATTYEASGYGNASFYMVDAAGDTDTFYAFQTYYLGNRKWKSGDLEVKAGDEVIIFGPVVNYKGNTPETVGKGASFVYSLNGKSEGGDEGQQTGSYGEQAGSGTKDDPYNVSKAHAVTAALAADGKIENVYVKGIISKIEDVSTQYGNATFYIVDKGYDGDYEIYRAYSLGGAKFTSTDEIKVGDEVIMYGTLTNFKGNTLEMTQGGQIYSLNGKTAGGGDTGEDTYAEPAGKGTEEEPFNVSRAIEKAKSIGETASEQVYYVKGKVKSVTEQYSAQYGNGTFVLVDEGYTAVFTAYRILYFNNQKWQEGDSTVSEGDIIVAAGKFVNYKGNTPEITANSGWLVSLNGKTSGGQQEPYLKVKSINQTATRGFSVSWSTNVKQGTYYSWSLYRKTTEVEDGVAYAAMGRVTDIATTSLNTYDGSADGAGWYEDLVPGEKYYFAINLYDNTSGVDPVVSNDPEEAYFTAKDMTSTGDFTEVCIALNNTTTFASDNGGDVLKDGWSATVDGWKVATFKYKSTSNPVTPDQYSMRVYKSAVFYIEAPDGVEIKKLVFKGNNYDNKKYILDMTGVEGTSGTAVADKDAETITWEAPSAGITKVILQAANGQTRLENVTITY